MMKLQIMSKENGQVYTTELTDIVESYSTELQKASFHKFALTNRNGHQSRLFSEMQEFEQGVREYLGQNGKETIFFSEFKNGSLYLIPQTALSQEERESFENLVRSYSLD